MPNKPKAVPCPHNEWVYCSHTAVCENCGWNPDVEAKRKAETLRKLEIEGEIET